MTAASFIVQALAGWLIADLLGGVAHWLEDRVLSESTPFLRGIVQANRRHHKAPMAFASGSFMQRNGTTFATAAIGSAIWLLLFGPSVMWAFATLGGLAASQVHYWTHVPPAPGSFLRVLQEIGIIQSPAMHAQHHRPPSDRRYCPLTNFLNPPLDALNVWGRLERLMPGKAVRP